MRTRTTSAPGAKTSPRILDAIDPAQLVNFLGGKQVRNLALRTVLETTIRIVPHISETRFMGLFDRTLANVQYPERREVLAETLLMTKRLLSSQEYRKSAATLLRRIVGEQSKYTHAQAAFIQKHGVKPLDLIVISPSMRCNLHCYGCYAGEYSKADDLPADVLKRVIAEAKDMGVHLAVISGGEPFISYDVLQTWEDNPDLSFIVYTNGTLIDASMARRLAKMGNVYPAISVEGFEPETDQRRGKGTFARVLGAMENLRQEGVLFGFSATATRANNELVSSSEFVDFFVHKGCMMGWYFNYMPVGRTPDLDLMPTPEQRIARWRRVRELRRTKPILLADFWCDGALAGGCIAGGRAYLHVTCTGDAEPCVFAHFAADNVKDKSLTEIIKSPLFCAIRSRQPYSPNLLRPCMIIDNPDVLRTVVVEGGAHPTHEGADTIVGPLASRLDSYAFEYGKLADSAWEAEHGNTLDRH